MVPPAHAHSTRLVPIVDAVDQVAASVDKWTRRNVATATNRGDVSLTWPVSISA